MQFLWLLGLVNNLLLPKALHLDPLQFLRRDGRAQDALGGVNRNEPLIPHLLQIVSRVERSIRDVDVLFLYRCSLLPIFAVPMVLISCNPW